MRYVIYGGAILLAILHQDFWWWDDTTLVGFMPIGLFYHALFSIAAAAIWALAVMFAWPSHIEEFAEEVKKEKEQADSGKDNQSA